MDLFDSSDKVTLVLLVISEALLCVQLITVLPIIAFLARTQVIKKFLSSQSNSHIAFQYGLWSKWYSS